MCYLLRTIERCSDSLAEIMKSNFVDHSIVIRTAFMFDISFITDNSLHYFRS